MLCTHLLPMEPTEACLDSTTCMQGVPLARRFALVPLGPPSLSYSSTCKALLKHDEERQEVQLTVDRPYAQGERVYAWCGPQPNSRLLLNYGIVDEGNPYDKLTVTATLPSSMPHFQTKRRLLESASAVLRGLLQLCALCSEAEPACMERVVKKMVC